MNNQKIRTVMLSTSDLYGGAYVAAYRVHKQLLKLGVDSKMLVQNKLSTDMSVIGLPKKYKFIAQRIIPILDQIPTKLMSTSNTVLHSPSWVPEFTINRLKKLKPDLVHLQWVNWGFLRPESLKKIEVPIVWTFHDMWAFCGSEHYTNDTRFIKGYSRLNRPSGDSGFDLDRWVWERKIKAWNDLNNLSIVTPSKWLAEKARKSFLFKSKKISVIPNGIDTKVFYPINKIEARKKLKLPIDKKIILCGAMSLEEPRKGGDLLLNIVKNILSNLGKDVVLVTYGHGSLDIDSKQVFNFNFIDNDKKLSLLYSSADIFLVTSRFDNLPNTIMESMACGTPSIAFKVGGIPDMIDHNVNGLLIKPFDIDAFSNAIRELIIDDKKIKLMSGYARKKVLEKFDINRVTKKYLELYNSLLVKNKYEK